MIDILKYTLPPIATAFLGYWFANRGKQKDINIQKQKELNTVLSNMLAVWDYLEKINLTLKFLEEPNDEMVYPREGLIMFLFSSGQLNEECFQQLEKSIDSLKQFDALTFHQIKGVGSKIEENKKTFVLPFLKSRNLTKQSVVISRKFLDQLLEEIEDSLLFVATKISNAMKKEIRERIAETTQLDIASRIEEANQTYYQFLMKAFPQEFSEVSYDNFIKDMGRPEIKRTIIDQLEQIKGKSLERIMELYSLDTTASLQDIIKQIDD